MKNIDKIKQMDSEELAELIDTRCDCCVYKRCRLDVNCKLGIKQWLEQELEE